LATTGSGAAALTAAILARDHGADVVMVEKSVAIGGTSSVSGGVLWLPGNDHMAEVGETDDRRDAIAYLTALAAGGDHDPVLIERFVDTAASVLRYLEARTPLRVRALAGFPDYYLDYGVPGTRPAGRSVEPEPYAVGDALPGWDDRLASRATLQSLGAHTTLAEDFAPPTDELRTELERRATRDVRTKGAALVAMLLRGLLDRGVDPLLETAARALAIHEGGVVGVHVHGPDGDRMIGARRGVVLACGGYEWNAALVRSFIGYEVHPLSPPNNVGDGLVMAMRAGAQLAAMTSYWGQPAMFDPEITSNGRPVPQFEWGRGEPSSLVVDHRGHRFSNEAAPYNDFTKAFGLFDASSGTRPHAAPAWLIFDQTVRDTTRVLSMQPGEPTPPWVAMHPGALGTTGGPRIDADARVLGAHGGPIPGLYAAGNTAGYHSRGGGTLGHSIVFGYLAGRHVAGQPPRDLVEH
jgi:3-oxosteroid 1-dehydrogenase